MANKHTNPRQTKPDRSPLRLIAALAEQSPAISVAELVMELIRLDRGLPSDAPLELETVRATELEQAHESISLLVEEGVLELHGVRLPQATEIELALCPRVTGEDAFYTRAGINRPLSAALFREELGIFVDELAGAWLRGKAMDEALATAESLVRKVEAARPRGMLHAPLLLSVPEHELLQKAVLLLELVRKRQAQERLDDGVLELLGVAAQTPLQIAAQANLEPAFVRRALGRLERRGVAARTDDDEKDSDGEWIARGDA